jgi:phosphoglycolate phosphatase-like HAD superfamily hydrolase
MKDTGLVFDVDGVLIDTSRSFPEVVSSAVSFCSGNLPGLFPHTLLFTKEHYLKTKQHPLFNDDYDIAWTFLSWAASSSFSILTDGGTGPEEWSSALRSCRVDPVLWVPRVFGNSVDRDFVRGKCAELYFGGNPSSEGGSAASRNMPAEGFWKNEIPSLCKNWRDLGRPTGIYTGRDRVEMQLALRLLKWEDFPADNCITVDDGIKKPSPEGLFKLESILGVSRIFYFGDSESDRKAFEGYGKGRFFPIGEIFASGGISFRDINEALAASSNEIR